MRGTEIWKCAFACRVEVGEMLWMKMFADRMGTEVETDIH